MIVIIGTFLGDKYSWLNPLIALLGALVHITVGSVFTLEALDPRFRHRHARTTLGAFIAFICGASHFLATIMFSIMREERTALIIQDDPDITKYHDKMMKAANTVIPSVRSRKSHRPSTIHQDFEAHSYIPRYKIWYRRKHLD